MGKKATQREAEERRNIIQKLDLEGLSRNDIARYCAEKYDIKKRQVEAYLQQINKEYKKNARFDRDKSFARTIARGEKLYFKSLKDNDKKAAIMVWKELNDLLGLKSIKLEHSGEVNFSAVFTMLEEIEAKKIPVVRVQDGES